MSSTETLPTYGGYHRPKGFGVGPFGPIGTGLLIALAFLVMLLVPLAGVVTSITVAILGGLGLLSLVWKDRYQQSALDRIGMRVGFNRAAKAGATEYLPGSLTYIGGHRLPGVLADSHLHVWKDKSGAEFTILEYPDSKLFVVNISAEPDGAGGMDPEDLTHQVEKYGEWLASLAYESIELVQASVCIETSQDSGAGLTLEMDTNESPNASWLAKKWSKDIKMHYPLGGSAIRTYITATFSAPKAQLDLDGNKIKGQSPVEAIGRLIADRLPHMLEDLPETGAGEVEPMTADEVIEAVRCAYNPEDREIYDICASKGTLPPSTLWDNVGPSGASAKRDHYVHSGGASITWETVGFISTRVISKVLMPILEPTVGVTKRVTWLYQPIDPAQAAMIAETDHRAAEGRILNAKKPTARQHRNLAEADTARANEASGAALMNFAILVTATVLDVANLADAKATVNHQGPVARLALRLMHGTQDSAFAQALGPLGLVTAKHLNIPTALTNGI